LGGGEGGSAGLGAWLDHASARLNGLARLFCAGLALAGHSCQATAASGRAMPSPIGFAQVVQGPLA
jgi:hypothetical protein